MKKGDIALKDDELVEITQIDYGDVQQYKYEESGSGWFTSKKKIPDGTKKELKAVWWRPVGDNRKKQWSNRYSHWEDWETMINKANMLIEQVKFIKDGGN